MYVIEDAADFNTGVALEADRPWPEAARGVPQIALANCGDAVTDFDNAIHLGPADDKALPKREWAEVWSKCCCGTIYSKEIGPVGLEHALAALSLTLL